MPRYVLKIKGKKETRYMIWSTIVDAPILYDMTREDVVKWWKREYGWSGQYGFDHMMKQVEETGSSINESPREIIKCNRAGKNERSMSYENIIACYVDCTKPLPS